MLLSISPLPSPRLVPRVRRFAASPAPWGWGQSSRVRGTFNEQISKTLILINSNKSEFHEGVSIE